MSLSARRGFRLVWVLVAAALWAAGCGEPQPPVPVGSIPGLTIEVGNTESVALAGYFSDPDGDALTYAAVSADEGVATVGVTGATLRVAGVGQGAATVTVTATDPGGLPATQEFSVTVPNRAPEAVGEMPDAEVFVGDSVEVALAGHFSDPDGDALTYSAVSADEGVATVGVTGATLRVAGVGQGAATVTVTATDPGGLPATQEFSVTVPNRVPEAVGEMPDAEVFVGDSVEVALAGYFSDPDGDVLTYAAVSADEGVATVGVAGATLRMAGVGQGAATVTVTATDPGGLPATQEFSVTVPNRAPEAVGEMPDAEVFVGDSVEVALAGYFSDPDGDALTYAAVSADEGAATVGVTGATLRVAGVGQGAATVTVTATDPGGLSATQEFSVTVPNRAPEAVGEVPDAEVFVGDSVEVALAGHFSDPDGDALTYAATSADEGVATVGLAGATLRVAGVGQGTATVTVTATDPGGLSATQEFSVTVPNRAPEAVGEVPDAEVFVGDSVEVALAGYFSDPDGDALTYSATSADEGVATVGVAGATLRVAGVGQGTATVTVTATDPGGLSATQEFSVTVPNRAPEAVGEMPDAEVFVGDSVEVGLAAYFGDPDGDALAYAATSADESVATVGASGATLRVAGVGQGTATVTVTATDPGGLPATQEFSVTVPNRAPEAVGEIPDAEVFVGDSVEVALAGYFSDPDGDALTYSATSADEGVATVGVAGATLRVAGVGQGAATVTVTATDPGGLSATQEFSVTVPNRAPEAVGEIPDAEVFVGESVEVALAVYFGDPDGDALTYSATSADESVATVGVAGATLRVAGVGQGAATVTVTATDPGGLSATQIFTATVPNRAPEAVGEIPDAEVFVGDSVEVGLAAYFGDPDGDALAYSATSADESVATVGASGATLRVAGVGQGTATVTVTATDPGGLSATQIFTATVPNRAPEAVGEIPDAEVFVGESVEVELAGYFSDPDGDALAYAATSADESVATVAVSGDTVAVTGVATGSVEVTVTASDGSLSATQTFATIVVGGRAVLEILYEETNGDSWTDNTNWLTDRPLDEWYGIGTDAYGRVTAISLDSNGLTGSIPLELGGLSSLQHLSLSRNSLTGSIPLELGGLSSLQRLYLSYNYLAGPIPSELGDLGNLQGLELYDNELTGPIPPELGDLGNLQQLRLSSNDLAGPIPPELGDLSSILLLHMYNNTDLEGELPSSFSKLTSLEEFLAYGTGLCVPSALWDWYRDIDRRWVDLCDDPTAYLVQAVQSVEDPVPVVADKEALLRVFVIAIRTTTETLPPATATFYVDDSETYSVDIDGTSEPIPTEIDEGSLDKSLNVTIPDSVIEEGLSVVIEIDPDSTIDAEILVARRIPESGELDIVVEGVPDFELTAVPFLYTEDPDSSVIETLEEMADDEEDHELLHDTDDLLPIEEMTVDDHSPVEIDSRSGLAVLARTRAIRAAESGSGYWMGLMPRFSDVGGVAYVPGTSSASVTNASVIAHELGHNLSLWHAPCGGPSKVDPYYPYRGGSIGVWGYDHRGDSLIDKDEAKDLMTYCTPEWVSDYHFEKAFEHRTAQEMSQGEARGRTGPSLLVWGARSPSGELSMDPALLVEGRSLLPEARGDYTLTGLDEAQRELFSVSFEMAEPADAEEGTGIFVFLLPVEPGWEALASLALAGPGDTVFTLDRDTEATMALIRDPRSGQVRAIRGDFAERPSAPSGHLVRWSRGVPDREAWRVMTGRGTGSGP